MEVLLKKNVDNLGDKDELVNVKPGYGRNFLIPQGLAILATESVRKMHAETLKQRAHKAAKMKVEAEGVAKKLEAAKIEVGAKVGENGKIFGSVTNVQLAEALDVDIREMFVSTKGDVVTQSEILEAKEFFKKGLELLEFKK